MRETRGRELHTSMCSWASLVNSRHSVRRLAARRTELVDGACDAVDAAAEGIKLAIGLEPLTRRQPFAKHAYLFVLVALIEAAACNRLIAKLLQKCRYGFDPDAPPIRRHGAPSRHRQAVAGGPFSQDLSEAGG